ncbi:MAG: hypothetical protein M3268_04055 [Acidobacteriota bacterium]|nr:hypothetical protein [Acidobacteriota bacterium]
MGDWIGLGIFVAVAVAALAASSYLGRPRKRISVEEFEERARSGGHTRAGMFGLQQLLHPKAVKAIEVQQDLRHGYYNKKRVPGDGEDDEVAAGGEETTGGVLRAAKNEDARSITDEGSNEKRSD